MTRSTLTLLAAALMVAIGTTAQGDIIKLVDTEAAIRGITGSGATTDQDEAALGYLMVKYNVDTSARHSYFQFDLTGQNADLSQAATFSMFLQSANKAQEIQVWALDQAYAGMASTITWDTAEANDKTSNEMLTTGALTATKIGSSFLVPAVTTVGDEFGVTSSSLGSFVFDNKITFAVTGVDNALNNAGGFRAQPGNSQLEFAAIPEPSSLALLGLGLMGLIGVRRREQR